VNRLRAALSCTLVALLCACSETRFESTPGDNIETCDVRWKGLWTSDDAKRDEKMTAFYIDDECRFFVLEQTEKGAPFKRMHVPLNYVHADGLDYLVIADTSLKGLVELPPIYGVKPPPDKAFFFAHYRARQDRIDVFQVDDRRVADAVIAGKFEGTVSKTANELHVFVRGDRTKMLEILRHGDIFVDKTDLHLVRVKQTPADFERALIEQQHKTP